MKLRIVALVAFPLAVCSAAGESAKDFFQGVLAEVNGVLLDSDLAPETRRERMVALYSAHVDFAAIANDALGEHAKRLDADQRERFDRLLRASLLDFWGRETLRYRGGPVELEDFGSFALSGNAYAVTLGRYRSGFGPANRDRERTRSRFLLAPRDDGWKIIRVQVGGVDVAGNFRRQIDEVFDAGKSADELLTIMSESSAGD